MTLGCMEDVEVAQEEQTDSNTDGSGVFCILHRGETKTLIASTTVLSSCIHIKTVIAGVIFTKHVTQIFIAT